MESRYYALLKLHKIHMKYLNAKTLKQLSNLKMPYHLPIEMPPSQVRGVNLVGKFGKMQKSLIVDAANLIFAKYHPTTKNWKSCPKEDYEAEARYGIRVTSTMKNFCEAQIKDSKHELEAFFKIGWIGYEVVLKDLSVSSIDPNQSFGQLSVDNEPIQEFFEGKIEEKPGEFFLEQQENFKDDRLDQNNQEISLLKARLHDDTELFKENLKEKEFELERLFNELNQSKHELFYQQAEWHHKQDELERNREKLELLRELADQDRNLVQTKLDEALQNQNNLEILKESLEFKSEQQGALIVDLNQSLVEKDLLLTSQKVEVINLHAKEKTLQGKVKEITDRLYLKSEEVSNLNNKITNLNKTFDESNRDFHHKLKPLEVLDELMKSSLRVQKLHEARLPLEWEANQCALENTVNKQEKALNNLNLEISEITHKKDQLINSLPKNYQELFKFEARVKINEELFWLQKDFMAFGGKDVEMKAAIDKLTQQLKELG